ncbi:acetyl-CoA carboxylase biotin carboxylase subunit family protein [Actinomadura keratinilytica]
MRHAPGARRRRCRRDPRRGRPRRRVDPQGRRPGRLPLICKPVRGVASKGVTRLDGPDDIARALDWGAVGAGDLDSPDLLVEPFLSGEEYSVESVSEDGEHLVVGVTRKLSEPDHFVEVGHVIPAPLPDGDERRIASTVRAMLSALGVRTGVTHTEVIVAPDAVHIVETHLRRPATRSPSCGRGSAAST